MAILNIVEARELARDITGQYIPVMKHSTDTVVQEITGINATPQSSSIFDSLTSFIRINSDIDIRFLITVAGTAGATSARLAADVTEIVGVPRNKDYIISVRTA